MKSQIDQLIDTLDALERVQQRLDEAEILTPACSDDDHYFCEGEFIFGTCVCKCHGE